MKIKVITTLKCPVCGKDDLRKAGLSIGKTQNYQCKRCGWVF